MTLKQKKLEERKKSVEKKKGEIEDEMNRQKAKQKALELQMAEFKAEILAKQKAAEMLKHRLLNDGIYTFIDKANIQLCPMEWENLKQERNL